MLSRTYVIGSFGLLLLVYLALFGRPSDLMAAPNQELRVHGFLKTVLSVSDNEALYDDEVTSKETYFYESVVGLNFSKALAENWEALIQLTAEGNDFNFDVSAERAFLKYSPYPWMYLKAGKQKTPFWLYSDYINIGVAYPWIHPPKEVYSMNPITNFAGFSLNIDTEISDSWNIALEVFTGGIDQKEEVENIADKAVIHGKVNAGISLAFVHEDLTLRGIFAQGTISTEAFGIDDWKINFWSVGFNYNWLENGFLIGEFARSGEVDLDAKKQEKLAELDFYNQQIDASIAENDANGDGIPDDPLLIPTYRDLKQQIAFARTMNSGTVFGHKAYYATIGYKIGEVFPHYTFAKVTTPVTMPIVGASQMSHIIGLRYNIESGIAIKAEYHNIKIDEGEIGLYSPNSDGSFPDDIEDTKMAKIGIDAFF